MRFRFLKRKEPRLRSHHLFCALTFVGKGYSPGFVAKMKEAVAHLLSGQPVVLIEDYDVACHACPHLGGCPETPKKDAKVLASVNQTLGTTFMPGDRFVMTPDSEKKLREKFLEESPKVCAPCPWIGLCAEVAGNGFKATDVG